MFKLIEISIILIKLFLAYITWFCFISRKNHINRTVVCGGFNGAYFKDNAYFLHKQISGSTDITSVYICNSVDENGFLKRNSIKSMITLCQAETIYVSHSESDVISYVGRLFLRKIVFVQHGVIGIKKLKDYEKKYFHKFLCSHEFELEVLESNFNLGNTEVIKSLLPRYKYLSNNVADKNSEVESVFLLLTWRDPNHFDITDYINNYKIILKYLSENFKIVNCAFHPALLDYINISEFYQHYSKENVKEVNGVDISHFIAISDMLVTDYSSVAWDFLYQGKPITFYQPDYCEYVDKIGIYMPDNLFFGGVIRENHLLLDISRAELISLSETKGNDFNKRYGFFDYNLNNILD